MAINKIISAIKKYETIIIHRHVRPDPDAYGSQVGLKEIIKESFPHKNVYAVGEADSSLNFLALMDIVKDWQYEDALVIVCDTANTERVCDDRYKLGKEVIKIDHHPNHDQYGDIMWVDTSASSTSEMVYELCSKAARHGFQMSNEAARLIYAGIVGDTGRFLFPSTTEKTFKIAADLVTYEFSLPDLYQGLYNIKDNIARLRGYILQSFTLSESGVSIVKLSQETLDKHGVNSSESGQLISVLGDIEGIVAWAFFIEEESLIRVRLRSKGPIINELAAKYNGGGHPLASGATVSSWEEASQLARELEGICKSHKNK